jgi:hypothetical protein
MTWQCRWAKKSPGTAQFQGQHTSKSPFLFDCFIKKKIHYCCYFDQNKSQDGSAGMAMGWMNGIQFPAGARDLFPFHSIQTASGVHPASYPIFPQE